MVLWIIQTGRATTYFVNTECYALYKVDGGKSSSLLMFCIEFFLSIWISPKFVPKGPIDNKAALVQGMA